MRLASKKRSLPQNELTIKPQIHWGQRWITFGKYARCPRFSANARYRNIRCSTAQKKSNQGKHLRSFSNLWTRNQIWPVFSWKHFLKPTLTQKEHFAFQATRLRF